MLARTLSTPLSLLVMLVAGGCDWHDPGDARNFVPATVDEDPTLEALDLRDTRLHVRVDGDPDDPLVVVLHGGPGDDYRYVEPLLGEVDGWSLSDAHEVVTFDQRGSGLSRRHPAEEVSLAEYLADLEALIDHFAPDEPVVLIGHSWGGMYAAMYMDAHPDRVAGAVLMEPGGLREDLNTDDTDFDYTSEWISDWLWQRQLLTLDDHARADYLLNVGALSDFQQQRNDEFSPWWRFGAVVKTELILGELLEDYDFTAHLRDVPVEVLLVAGARTEDIGEAYQQRHLEFFRDASIAVVADAGHGDLTWSHVDDSLRLIRAYLGRVER